jgi:hypothetical protein
MINTFKEYFDIDEYYLKINLNQEKISLISFDTLLLDGITYHFSITNEDIKNNKKYNDMSLKEVYEKIVDSIENKKFVTDKENDFLILSLFEGDNFDINKDFQFILIKSTEKNADYESAMKKIILSLRKENDNMKGQLELLSLNKKAESAQFLGYPRKNFNIKEKSDEQNNNGKFIASVQPIHPKTYIEGEDKNQKVNVGDKKNSKKISLTQSQRIFDKKNSLDLSISTLANLDFGSYPSVELSQDSSNIIAGYGANSYNGLIRKNNEDKIKVVPNYKLTKEVKKKNGEIINPNISYFAIYDGHGGNKCSIFLQENLHNYIFSSDYFPLYTMQAIKGAFVKAENNFSSTVIESGNLIDKSGSCAVSVLIMDEWCFVINLGDSRALYSFDSGNKLFQITRDHKPNDPIEKERIEKAGGKIYKDEFVTINGKRIKADEKNLPPGLVLPYRVLPGNLAVSILILIFII